MGEGCARALAEAGARVLVVARTADEVEAVAAEIGRRIPTGELATVEQVADAVRYLACDASGSVTGTVLRVDGGWTAW